MHFKTIPVHTFSDSKGSLLGNLNCVHCTDDYIKKCKHQLTPFVVGVSQSVELVFSLDMIDSSKIIRASWTASFMWNTKYFR